MGILRGNELQGMNSNATEKNNWGIMPIFFVIIKAMARWAQVGSNRQGLYITLENQPTKTHAGYFHPKQ